MRNLLPFIYNLLDIKKNMNENECIKCASNGVSVSKRQCYDCGHIWCPNCGNNFDGSKCPACESNNTGNSH